MRRIGLQSGSSGFDMRSVDALRRDEEHGADDGERVENPVPVTTRIRRLVQPEDGWLPVRLFERVELDDPRPLDAVENIPPDIAGLAVDYLTRFMQGAGVRDAFRVPLAGACLVGRSDRAERLLSRVRGLDGPSVRAACGLVDYDSASRRGPAFWRPGRVGVPDDATVWNVRCMVERSLRFFEAYGPVVWQDFSFEGAYTDRITAGDGDFLTRDTLWDFKVSRHEPNPTYTLQLLVYWRMGLHSVYPVYKDIRRLGFYNPRLNTVYLLDVSRISESLCNLVDRRVIGYR